MIGGERKHGLHRRHEHLAITFAAAAAAADAAAAAAAAAAIESGASARSAPALALLREQPAVVLGASAGNSVISCARGS